MNTKALTTRKKEIIQPFAISLTAEQFQQLADVPAEETWLRNKGNKQTRANGFRLRAGEPVPASSARVSS